MQDVQVESRSINTSVERIRELGYAVLPRLVDPLRIAQLIPSLPPVPSGGIRNAMTISPLLADLGRTGNLSAIAAQVLGAGARVTRAILFDKTPEANWRVPWHQDTTIAVRQRVDLPGFGPWSFKDGVVHVKPPSSVLERVLTLRLHMDPCADSNGPLMVLPCTHRQGYLSDVDSVSMIADGKPVTCVADVGDVVAFHPLLLHSSPKAVAPAHRRVLHLEFATGVPAEGLEWHEPDPNQPDGQCGSLMSASP